MDELEAMRLADVEGLYHEEAAKQMGVSRRTFGRMIESARKKAAQALTQGMALRIEGGVIEMTQERTFKCTDCKHEWKTPFGTGRPTGCPACESENFQRVEEERGGGRRRRGGGSQGRAVGPGKRGRRRSEATTETETVATKGSGRQGRRRRRGANVPAAGGRSQ
jgi:uncharacterized protein